MSLARMKVEFLNNRKSKTLTLSLLELMIFHLLTIK